MHDPATRGLEHTTDLPLTGRLVWKQNEKEVWSVTGHSNWKKTSGYLYMLVRRCRFTLQNRRFPEITGEDNLTMFSYSRRVKSPEWRWQRRRADLRHFEIFRHGPIIIYTRLPAGGTYYPICTFPRNSERLIGISDAFSALFTGIRHLAHVLTVPPTKA